MLNILMTTCKLAALHIFCLCLYIIFLVFVTLKFQIGIVSVNKMYFMAHINKAFFFKLVAQGYKWKDRTIHAVHLFVIVT